MDGMMTMAHLLYEEMQYSTQEMTLEFMAR